MQLFSWYLFVAANFVLVACLWGLLRSRSWKQYPILFSYIAFQLTGFLIVFFLDRLLLRSLIHVATYRWIMAAITGAQTILELGVLYELAVKLILSRPFLTATLRSLVRWSGAALILAASVASAWLAKPAFERVVGVFESVNFASNLIVIGLLFVLLLFSRALQVPWRSLPAGVALGFGIMATAEMASAALVSTLGTESLVSMDAIRMSAFFMCVLIWLFYIFLPDRSVAPSITLAQSEMEFWDHQLQRMVRR